MQLTGRDELLPRWSRMHSDASRAPRLAILRSPVSAELPGPSARAACVSGRWRFGATASGVFSARARS